MSYTYKRALTIDGTQCGTVDSLNFPVLVRITDATLKTVANSGKVQNSNGYDIGFFSDYDLGTPLFWEMDSYDGSAGTVLAWVNLPAISATLNTVFYIAYGDSGISTFQSTASSAWNSNFKGVWHFGGSGPSMSDSTTNGTTFTTNSGVAATGQIAGGVQYGGSTFSSNPDATPLGFVQTTPRSFTMWVYPTSILSYQTLYWKSDSNHWILLNGNGNISVQMDGTFTDITLTVNWAQNAWNHIAVTGPGSGGTGSVYVNGQLAGTFASGTAGQVGNGVAVGLTSTSSYPLSGTVDELKVSNVARPLSWILAEYNNQKSGSTFLAVGAEVPPPTGLTAMSHRFAWFDMGDQHT